MVQSSVMDELVEAGSRLSSKSDFSSLISVLVEQSSDYSRADLTCLYLYSDISTGSGKLKISYRRGQRDVPRELPGNMEFAAFLRESGEAVVLSTQSGGPFSGLFLTEDMKSGIALPLVSGNKTLGILILNSSRECHFGNSRFRFLDALTRMAGGLLGNSLLMKQLKEHLARIEELERYQESIFTSMTNLLVTTDEDGQICYFNSAAEDAFGLTASDLGSPFESGPGAGLGKKVLKNLIRARDSGAEYTGIEGILKRQGSEGGGEDVDYSLNLAPLRNSSGRVAGQTLLFTDQSREQRLKAEADLAVEDRRRIKDMFSRYLSKDLVKNLTDNPEMVKPGGDKKTATVFFADITGYTAFSEGRDPAHIIEVLNGFFEDAVEIVIRNKGYIDKFIGDCIMAAWGVPMKSETEDAVLAVTTALEIHEAVRSSKRSFFRGDASELKISVGMSSGPLVAGNVGSSRRMDYTVLGDTVNTAARLEGIAKAEEIIVSSATRDLLGDHFVLEERSPVKVKGKKDPLVIFNVKGVKR